MTATAAAAAAAAANILVSLQHAAAVDAVVVAVRSTEGGRSHPSSLFHYYRLILFDIALYFDWQATTHHLLSTASLAMDDPP